MQNYLGGVVHRRKFEAPSPIKAIRYIGRPTKGARD